MAFDSFEELNVGFETAQMNWQQGNLLAAYDLLYQILTYRVINVRLIDADLKVVQFLADLAGMVGEFQAADDLLDAATVFYRGAGDYHSADYTCIRRAQIWLDRGNILRVRRLLADMAPRIGQLEQIQISPAGLAQWENGCTWVGSGPQERTVLFAELYLLLGRLLLALGQYNDAQVILSQGLSYANLPTSSSLASQTIFPFRLEIASAYLEQGDLAVAGDHLKSLKESLDQEKHQVELIYWLELSGKRYLLLGEFGKALEIFRQIRSDCGRLGARRAALRSTLNLAHALILLNQTSTALAYLIDARQEAQDIGDEALLNRAKLLIYLAQAREISPIPSLGIPQPPSNPSSSIHLPHQLFISNASSNYLTWFEDRALEFYLQLSQEDISGNLKLADAASLLDYIKKTFQSTDSDLIKVRIQVLENVLSYYTAKENLKQGLKQMQRTQIMLEQTCSNLEVMGLKPELWQAQQFLIWCLRHLQAPDPEQEKLIQKNDHLLQILTQSLPPEEQAIFLLNKWTSDEEYIAAIINQIQRPYLSKLRNIPLIGLFCNLIWMQQLNHLISHIDRYKDALAKKALKGKDNLSNKFSVRALWHRLICHPRDRMTISFLVLPDRVLVIRLGWLWLDFFVISTTRLAVRNLVQLWHQKLQGVNQSRDFSETMEEYSTSVEALVDEHQQITNLVADLLKIPAVLAGLPKRIKSLTIIPDDILHGFPFAVLPYQKQHLIDRYALTIGYEMDEIRSRNRTIASNSQALVVGVAQGTGRIRPLPHVRQESKHVQSWLQSNKIAPSILEDSTANKTAVLQSLPQADLLHIACHGVFEPNRPDQSGFILIPNTQKPEEILSLRELSELDLSQVCHATLSSCWAANHFVLPGRWVISLPETLWRSGTQSILGCLWEVHDEFAASFMAYFYENLRIHSREEALRRTQQACLKGELAGAGVNTSNPVLWAGFSLYGNYRPLIIPHRKSRQVSAGNDVPQSVGKNRL